jgi:hypothetical protein
MKRHHAVAALLAVTTLGTACARRHPVDEIAAAYVKLVLAVGEHEPDYVDAYYGPADWRDSARADSASLITLHGRTDVLLARLDEIPTPKDEMGGLRHAYLHTQLRAVRAMVEMLQGKQLSFDDESRALYDAVAPINPDGRFEDILRQIDAVLPGEGPVQERYEHFRQAFVVPGDRTDTVFRRAIAECRARTLRDLRLPAGERFTVEYVTGKPWSGYNWYQGKSVSLIQVNTDLPIFIDRAVDLACHEGYPGHHVYNTLLEDKLVRERGWVEYTVYPLFSPQSLIAEGSAHYGIELAFPGMERVAFEREVLFPLAGLDPAEAEPYYRVQGLVAQLDYAGNEAARRYLNGEITAEQAGEWLVTYAMMSPERAAQRVRFIDRYRTYVINYNLGKDLVAAYVERAAGDDPEQRWQVFGGLLGSPRLPSGLHP